MYKLTKDGTVVIRESDGAFIPMTDGNRDYQEYQEWLVEGGVPAACAEPSTTIPSSITQRQMRLTLLDLGIYNQVEAYINSMAESGREDARVDWIWAQEIKRDHPLLVQLTEVFNLNNEEVDNLFLSAASK